MAARIELELPDDAVLVDPEHAKEEWLNGGSDSCGFKSRQVLGFFSLLFLPSVARP